MSSPQTPRPRLPQIEQPVMVGFEMEDFIDVANLTLDGMHAAAVVRAGQYKDFDEEVLMPILEERRLSLEGTQTFERTPLPGRMVSTEREGLHLDAEEPFDPSRRVTWPRTLTLARMMNGHGILVAGAGSSKVRGYTGAKYQAERLRLNRLPRVRSLYERRGVRAGFNAVRHVEHNGLRGDLGLLYLGEGDVALIPQGGEGSASPSWHAIITQDAPRRSLSYHAKSQGQRR